MPADRSIADQAASRPRSAAAPSPSAPLIALRRRALARGGHAAERSSRRSRGRAARRSMPPRPSPCRRGSRRAPAPPTARAPPTAAAPPTASDARRRRPPCRRAAPAPSCGAPETRPEAMPGPKMPRPNSARLASTRLIACSRSGSWPCSALVNSAKKFEPMPTMTASTITLMPERDDVAEHALGEEAGPVPSANGTSTKPARLVSLNSRMVTNICTARMKKATMTITQAISSTMIVRKLVKKPIEPDQLARPGRAAARPPRSRCRRAARAGADPRR